MRKRKNSIFYICCICIGLVLFCGAGYMLISELNNYHKASHIYKETDKIYVTYTDINIKPDKEDVQNTENLEWENLIDVDLAGLRKKNKDIAGWIYFENVDISYPILYSGDNSEYLRKTYTGDTAKAGSIFVDGNNSSDFSDVHTIIYGHNMKDLSMFGRLKYYAKDKDFISGHEYFQIITENKKYRYKIISYKVVSDDSDVYTIYKNNSPEFETFVRNVLRKGSYLDSEEVVEESDHIITLSTCSGDNRFVVSSLRCDEYIIN